MTQPKKHTHNYKPTWKTQHEKNDSPSETIQDEAYTVKELYNKFVTNQKLPDIKMEGLYEDNPDLDNPPIDKHPTYDPLEDRRQQNEFINKAKQKAKTLEEKQSAEEAPLSGLAAITKAQTDLFTKDMPEFKPPAPSEKLRGAIDEGIMSLDERS